MRSVVLDDNEVATILSELVESVCEGAPQFAEISVFVHSAPRPLAGAGSFAVGLVLAPPL